MSEELLGGNLSDDEKGKTAFRVGSSNDGTTIIIDFTSPTTWIGLSPGIARQLAMDLMDRAFEMDGIILPVEGSPVEH